jgi:DNA-binding NtrC family response regulator
MKLLLVEDDRIVRITVRDALEDAGYDVVAHADGAAALRAAEGEAFDLVLTDVRLPGLDGLALLRALRRFAPDVAVLLMTAFADADDAVAALRAGARDYITKPFEMDELLVRIGRVRDEVAFRRRMESGEPSVEGGTRIRGTSPAIVRLLDRVAAAAESDVNVIVTGETGTGKDLCARVIHERGRRAKRPFVVVNCAAIPEPLFEAELFGHERGAFTGADRKRVGRFEAAAGGTLFLDEVGELSLGNQAKLLRAIETSTFEPLGSNRTVRVDVRLVAATNRDLAAEVDRGAFRRDLYYRLNVIDLEVPPLRERRADVPILVNDFLVEIAARAGRPVPALDPSVVAALAAYDFPGNVRELVHALERAIAMARGDVIRLDHLPPALVASAAPPGATGDGPPSTRDAVLPLSAAVEQFERQYIARVVSSTGGHRGRAAALLGISRKSLWQKLKGVDDGDDPE